MPTWNPVIDGLLHRPVTTHVLPRIGERVLLADGQAHHHVVDVQHYAIPLSGSTMPLHPDVHLTLCQPTEQVALAQQVAKRQDY